MKDRISASEYLTSLGVKKDGGKIGQRMTASEYHRHLNEQSRMSLAPVAQACRDKGVEGKPKVRRAQPEFDEQVQLFEWARCPLLQKKYPALALMSCSLNGVKLTAAQAGKALAAGMLKGESDVRLPVARGSWIGLIIEMKAGDNKPTEDQLKYGALMEAEGHLFKVCWSADEAIAVCEAFLEAGPFKGILN